MVCLFRRCIQFGHIGRPPGNCQPKAQHQGQYQRGSSPFHAFSLISLIFWIPTDRPRAGKISRPRFRWKHKGGAEHVSQHRLTEINQSTTFNPNRICSASAIRTAALNSCSVIRAQHGCRPPCSSAIYVTASILTDRRRNYNGIFQDLRTIPHFDGWCPYLQFLESGCSSSQNYRESQLHHKVLQAPVKRFFHRPQYMTICWKLFQNRITRCFMVMIIDNLDAFRSLPAISRILGGSNL